ncbi:histidine kinase [Elizabethkingia occulta]|uniref:histidine kinase n=1 Tax=Elizabethkingia occulta TaxID=1867263 RepID=UPI00398C715E
MSLNEQIKKDLIDFQLNSHFIYNTLNNIYASAVIKPEIVLEAVQSLANLFRYTSQEVDREFISIKTEMSYVKNFSRKIKIKKSRKYYLN